MSIQSLSDHAEGAAGAVTLTIAAQTDREWVIDWISIGTDVAIGVNTPQMSITHAGTEYFVSRMNAEAPYHYTFPGGLSGAARNEAVALVLTGFGAGTEVHVNVGYH